MTRTRTGAMSLALLFPACCVATATRVLTPSGEVAAGSLVPGDRVWSIELPTGRLVEGTVVAVRRAVRECMALHWRGGTLICTADHPLYDPERAEYRPAGEWLTGAARRLLQCTEAGPPRVVAVERVEAFAGVHEVVDLTLAGEPRNFLAAGLLVHNKSYAPPRLTEEVDGPVVDLTTVEREHNYRVRACLDGEDIEVGWIGLDAEARPIPIPEGGKALWLSAFVEGQELEVVDGAAPGALEVTASLPPTSCSDGFVVGFMRLDERTDGRIEVTWRVEVEVDDVYTELDDALSIVVEREP